MSLCMWWLYVVMLSGLPVTAWWLEPRDCHLNVNIIEIGYTWWWQVVHGGPRQGEGVPRHMTGSYNFVPRPNFRFLVSRKRFLKRSPRQRFLRLPPRQLFWNGCHGNEIFAVMSLQLEIEDDHGELPAPRAIPYHAIMNCLRCLSLCCLHPLIA